MMDVLGWVLITALFVVGMLGAIYPILPGALAIYGAFFVYGWFFTFEPFGWMFWTLQTLIVVVLFIADYAVSAWGVSKFGGSRASVFGSTIGIIIGPFVLPAFGLIIGPFAGGVIGELIHGSTMKEAVRAGIGALVGLLTSVVVKFILQFGMIIAFVVWLFVN